MLTPGPRHTFVDAMKCYGKCFIVSIRINQWDILGKEQTYNKWLDIVFRMSIGFVHVNVV